MEIMVNFKRAHRHWDATINIKCRWPYWIFFLWAAHKSVLQYEFKQLLTNLSYYLFLHFAFLNYYFRKSNSRFNRVWYAEVDRRYLILNYEFRVYFCARDLQQLTHMCTLIWTKFSNATSICHFGWNVFHICLYWISFFITFSYIIHLSKITK